jgi:hypothetical protein
VAQLTNAGVALEDLGEILREGRACHHNVRASFLSLHFQFSLNVRQVADQADALQVAVGFELQDQLQGRNGIVIQIDNDQQRVIVPGFLDYVKFGLQEFNIQTSALGGIADFNGEQKIVHHCENFLLRVIMHMKTTRHSESCCNWFLARTSCAEGKI